MFAVGSENTDSHELFFNTNLTLITNYSSGNDELAPVMPTRN